MWTIIKIIPLIAVIGLAAYVLTQQGTAVVRPFATQDLTLSAISAATILTLWAMLGLETATVPADKVENAERTIGRATLLGTGGAGLVYILVCSAVVLMLPAALTAASPAPFALFVETFGGANAGTAIAAFGHWWLGSINWELLAMLLLGSVPGITIGSLAARSVPEKFLRGLLATTLTGVAAKLNDREIKAVADYIAGLH